MEVLITLIFTIFFTFTVSADQRICWFTNHTFGYLSAQTLIHFDDELEYNDDIALRANQTCSENANYCYALWREVQHQNNSKSNILVIAQGCWESSGKQDCENITCVTSSKPPKALKSTNFCCCKENFCNGNMTQMYYPDDIEISPAPDDLPQRFDTLILVFLLVLFVLMAMCLSLFIFTQSFVITETKKNKKAKSYYNLIHLMENRLTKETKFQLEKLKLEELIGQGKYGTVWRGSVENEQIAVKIFQSQHKNYFYNEVEIYSSPLMAHPCLLSYLGCEQSKNINGNIEYMLFLSLVPKGNIQDFLISNIIDWNIFCKMCLSIAQGVAYLHMVIKREGKFKPCISHRDLNTKNILVKEDLSCVICDLGYATKISGSRYYYNGEEQRAEIKSINEVGTLRYMAPEVLEGAVNLRDCETALKQIDVYALGLIFWEITTRCKDFYHSGFECEPYRRPFEVELGQPTFEQMQHLVCKNKQRPLFPKLWKDSKLVRSVKETIEDCWDQDAEARLTTFCIEERFHDLLSLSESQRVSVNTSIGLASAVETSLPEDGIQNFPSPENKIESRDFKFETNSCKIKISANHKKSNPFNKKGNALTIELCQKINLSLKKNLVTGKGESNLENWIDTTQKCAASDFKEVLSNRNMGHLINKNEEYFSDPPPQTNNSIPFLQNVKFRRPISLFRQFNLSVERLSQCKKMSLNDLIKLPGKITTSEIDNGLNTILICDENLDTLSSPVTPSKAKKATEVFLQNGKLGTKIKANQWSLPQKFPIVRNLENECFKSAEISMNKEIKK